MLLDKLLKLAENVDVSEVYSPPRVTVEAMKFGLKAGEAFDLTNGWDLSNEDEQKFVKEYVRKNKPMLLIGSPECKMFSSLQNLSAWTASKAKRLRKAKRHIRFCMELYEEQMSEGRLFLHEHPANATSWQMEEVRKVATSSGVRVVVADQCMYGLRVGTVSYTHLTLPTKRIV